MKSIRLILFTGMWIISSALLAQSKNEMPFTSASAEAKQMLRNAWVLFLDVRFEEGGKLVTEALQKDSTFALAHAFQLAPDATAREKNFKKALSLPLSADEKMLLEGFSASENKKSPDEFYNALIKKYPKDYDLQTMLMYNHREAKRSAEIGEGLIKRNPKYAPVYNKLGYDYLSLGNMKRAEASFNKYEALRPDLNNVYDSKADYLMKVGKIQEAITSFEKAASMGMTASAGRADLAKAKLKYAGPSDQDKQAIKNIINGIATAFLKSDVDGILKYYSDQAIELAANQRTNAGLGNIRVRMEGIRNGTYEKYTRTVDGIEGAGGIAVAWGKIESGFKSGSSGQLDETKLDYITMFRKQKDGQWKIIAQHGLPQNQNGNAQPAKDSADIRALINKWSFVGENGKEVTQQQVDSYVATFSQQAVEILPNQQSNIGHANVRLRNEGAIGVKWAQFMEYAFDINAFAQVGGRKAVVWGVGDHSVYRRDTKESSKTLFPFAMILTKEKDDQWKILVYQFYLD